jgi:hypothetical protein
MAAVEITDDIAASVADICVRLLDDAYMGWLVAGGESSSATDRPDGLASRSLVAARHT